MTGMLPRYIAFYGARGLGCVLAVLWHPISANLFFLGSMAALLAALDGAFPPHGEEARSWLTVTNLLSIWALALIGGWVVQQRQRLLISRFEDLTDDKANKQGLSHLLASELTQLRDLFEEFEYGSVIQTTADESRAGAPAERSQLFDATVQVDAPSAFLESTISAESTLAFGPLKIPFNAVLGLVNRLVQGPRLAGQVQSDGSTCIVTVELTVRGVRRQWRVDGVTAGDTARPFSDFARELAFRMFADMAFDRPVRWTAVAALISGLRAYRSTLRTTKEGRLNLHEAERHLLNAIAEDNRFDLAYYNLGVVYSALERPQAALSAFARSLELNPRRFAGHYALARVRYRLASALSNEQTKTRQLRFALDHCDQAVELANSAQARAKALNLQALSQAGIRGIEFFFAAKACRRAVRQAWHALLSAELALPWRIGPAPLGRQQAAELAASSLQLLAYIGREAIEVIQQYQKQRRQRLARWFLDRESLTAARFAAWLQPSHYDKLLDLGAVWMLRGCPWRAGRVLRRCAQLTPDRGEAWCWLALANAHLFREDWVFIAYDKAINAGAGLSPGLMEKLASATELLADETESIKQQIIDRRARVKGKPGPRGALKLVRWQWRVACKLSGRRLSRLPMQMHAVVDSVWGTGALVQGLEARIQLERRATERAREFVALRDEASRLAEDKEKYQIDELKKLWDKVSGKDRAWEAGDVASAIARAALRHNKVDDAKHWFEAAIKEFVPLHPREVGRRALDAGLAVALLHRNNPREALNAARRAVAADPLNSFARDTLADCHFGVRDWAAAREQWEESLRIAPDEALTYHNIGVCWLNEGVNSEDREGRKARFRAAADNLERALTLHNPEQLAASDCQFLLGQVQGLLGDPVAQQTLWHALENRNYRPIYLGLHLADSKLREISLRDAEERFLRLEAQIDEELSANKAQLDDPIDASPSDLDTNTYGTAAVWAKLGAAVSLARRYTAFDKAKLQVRKARAVVSRLKDDGLRQRWMGHCDRLDGEVAFRQGDMAAAVKILKKSIATVPSAEDYYYLATALLEQLDPKAARLETRASLMQIRGLTELAGKLNLDGALDEQLAKLTSRLDAADEKQA